MARISGIDIPNRKAVEYGLTSIYGIGLHSSREICTALAIDPSKKVELLTEEEVGQIRRIIEEKYTTEGQLRTEIAMNIKRLQEIGSFRGMRHRKGLPVRGQRTRTNARTRKGRKKTVSNKKK